MAIITRARAIARRAAGLFSGRAASSSKPRRRSFMRDVCGAMALEFVFLAPMFFLTLFAIFETSLIGLAKSGLKTGVAEAARQVRVGAAQCIDDRQAIEIICSLTFAPNCEDNTTITREVFSGGAGGGSTLAGSFEDVGRDEIVMLTAEYRWSVVTPILRPFFGDAAGDRILTERFVFKTEEFDVATCP